MNKKLNLSLHLLGQWVKLLNRQDKLLALGLDPDMGKRIRLGWYRVIRCPSHFDVCRIAMQSGLETSHYLPDTPAFPHHSFIRD